MRFRREESAGQGIINLESLLDVMFILLIFFMATTTFKEEEYDIKVKLTAVQRKHTSLSSQSKVMVINVRDVHSKDANPDEALYVVEGKRINLLELRKMVADKVTADKTQKVLIRGDRLALHGDVAKAVAACRNGGVDEAKIAYADVATE
ncbi:MAG: biopolymer transporter ExbD [Phycisphaerae bacterium]|jgi:biopolymer transport protein ExbD|nr:biopolymer transporter ExbD [Phycisphaerae bacterium]